MSQFGVGASVRRKEDSRFLRGEGQYVGDIRIPGMLEVAFFRSPVAHGRIRQINVPERFRRSVFLASDLVDVNPIVSAPPIKGFKRSSQYPLAKDKVRYVGEIVAMCVANSRAEAEDCAGSISLDFEELPAVTDMLAALEPNAPLLHEDWSNNIFVEFGENRDFDDSVQRAPIKVSRQFRTARHCMFPMEGRGVVAYTDTRLNLLTVATSTQFPHSVQTGLSECLGIDHGRLRVLSPDVGGGFGYKGLLCCEEVLVAWLARRLGCAVRWLEDCREHLAANANCREHYYDIRGYGTEDGRLIAIDCTAYVDAGAYSSYPISSAVEAAQIPNLLPGPYVFSHYRCRSAAVATNKCPIIPYRGVARTHICLAIESIMDAIAKEAKLEPYEVRLRNMVKPEQMPYDNLVGKHFDSGDHPECLRRAVDAINVSKIRERQTSPEPDGRLIGVGLSFFVEQGAHGTSVLASWGRPIVPGYEQANIKLTADGEIEIHVGTHSHGQGHETSYAQVAHQIVSVDFDKIKIYQGDTLTTPYSTATWGSRSMVYGGGAVATAARLLSKRIKYIAGWLLQADAANVRLEGGKAVAGNSSVSIRDVARAWYLQPQNLPSDVDIGGLEVTAGYRAGRDSGTFAYAAHAAVVAVDPQTGIIEILDYVVVEDGGTLVNPMIVDGQIHGGTAQGIGTCLYEQVPFDSNGQPLASTMMDYLLPGATEVPNIRVLHMEIPSPYTEFGVKGIGEGGAVGPPAAIMSAVNDALKPLGAGLCDLPITPGAVLEAIDRARQQGYAA